MLTNRTHSAFQRSMASGTGRPRRRMRQMIASSLTVVLLGTLPAAPAPGIDSIQRVALAAAPQLEFTSIDTMKESMDTDSWGLTATEIADDVNLAASLNPTYITVDTHMNNPAYMAEWVNAVRATGKHVWFRIHWNHWEGDNGTSPDMTPSQYLSHSPHSSASTRHVLKNVLNCVPKLTGLLLPPGSLHRDSSTLTSSMH